MKVLPCLQFGREGGRSIPADNFTDDENKRELKDEIRFSAGQVRLIWFCIT